jgi:hypothetical protein
MTFRPFSRIPFRILQALIRILLLQGGLLGATADAPLYLGEIHCRHCHGGAEWSHMEQYPIWSQKDPHSRSFASLDNPLSREIASLMGLPEGQQAKWEKCVRCHVAQPVAELRGDHYRIEEGISCEGCHGPAERWIVPHVLFDATHSSNVAHGMIDLKDLRVRTEVCLRCHSNLDHEIVAAGHPDLSFELLHYSFWQPPHWNYREASPMEYWFVGQSEGLVKALEDLAMSDRDPTTGDLFHIEAFEKESCFGCHNKLSQDRWRKVEALSSVFLPASEILGSDELSTPLGATVSQLRELMSSTDPSSKKSLWTLANRARDQAVALSEQLEGIDLTDLPAEKLSDIIERVSSPLAVEKDFQSLDPELPTAWMIRYFDVAEQKTLALKCLSLAGESPKRDSHSLHADVRREVETKGDRMHRVVQSLDALWGFVGSSTPEARMRQFDPNEFNEALTGTLSP